MGLIFMFVVLKRCTHLCSDLNTIATILFPVSSSKTTVKLREGQHIIVTYPKHVFVAKQQKQQTCLQIGHFLFFSFLKSTEIFC